MYGRPVRRPHSVGQRQEQMIHVITIPNWHPTRLNRLINCHWATRNRRKKRDYEMLAVYAMQASVPKATTARKVLLHLTMAPRQHKPDADSLWKGLLDGLVSCGQLVNDSPKWCVLGSVSFDRGTEAATRITLEDL